MLRVDQSVSPDVSATSGTNVEGLREIWHSTMEKREQLFFRLKIMRHAFTLALFGIVVTCSFPVIGQELIKVQPVAPLSKVYFKDEFEGTELSDKWEVVNPDPERFVVEDGALLIVAKVLGGLRSAESPNLFRLKKELPQGDWVVTLKLKVELQTARESLEFGLFTDPGNFIVTQIWSKTACCPKSNLYVRIKKVSGSGRTLFDVPAWSRGWKYDDFSNSVPQPISIKLVKTGRTYMSAIHFNGQTAESGEPIWIETNFVTSLRPPKHFAINASQFEAVSGESLFLIESVTIETQ